MSTPERKLELGRVGESVRRIDAIPKVASEFAYASDLYAADMLWGHTVRSPHAHALITAIDTTRAAGMPGVHAVLTHEDVPGEKRYGLEFPDQPVLAFDRVRYHGEPVRSSRPSTPSSAARRRGGCGSSTSRSSRSSIPSAPPKSSRSTRSAGPTATATSRTRARTSSAMVIRHGDPDAEADVVVEGTYELGIQDQAFLGPESGLAVPDGEGGVDIYVATQWLHVDRDQVAPCLGLTPNRVRIHLAGVGGAFRRARGPLHADPRRHARAAHEPPREVRLQPRGVVRRPHPPPPGAHLDATRGTATEARLRFTHGSCSTAERTPRAPPP